MQMRARVLLFTFCIEDFSKISMSKPWICVQTAKRLEAQRKTWIWKKTSETIGSLARAEIC
jgi:hypothetical protein